MMVNNFGGFSLVLMAIFTILIFLLSVLWLLQKLSKPKAPLPPGPWRIPFFGSITMFQNLLDSKRRHDFRIAMGRKYKKILYFKIGSLPMVWLNDIELIKEAFVTKGDILSDRRTEASDLTIIEKTFGAGKGIAAANYDKNFRDKKMLTMESMKDFGFAGKTLKEMVSEEAGFLNKEFKKVADGLSSSKVHQKFIHYAVANVICSVIFGRRFDYLDNYYVNAVDSIRFFFTQDRSNFITQIPWTNYLPYVKKIQQKEIRHLKNISEFIELQYTKHASDFDVNSPRDFIDLALKHSALSKSIDKDNITKISFDLFFAGTDTTASTLLWFLLHMVRYPDIQKRCQEELDRVLGTEIIGSATNPKDFPLTMATLLEVQRVSCIAGESLPHVAREELVVGGFRIPAGSFVFANVCHLHFDPNNWVDPENFYPERWLDATDPTKLVTNINFIPFSFGKRKCLGENLAKTEYFIFAISLLKNFRFKVANPEVLPPIKGHGFIHSPIPYEMIIECR